MNSIEFNDAVTWAMEEKYLSCPDSAAVFYMSDEHRAILAQLIQLAEEA